MTRNAFGGSPSRGCSVEHRHNWRVTNHLCNVAEPVLVIDEGVIAGRGWAVVKASAVRDAGLYDCNPDKVLDIIR